MSFISNFLKLFDLLSRVERRQAALLLCLILFMSFLEAVGVLSVLPFFAVLANPQLIDSNPILKAVYDNFGFNSQKAFLFALGFAVVFLLVISLVIKALTIFFQTKFALMREYAISKRLVEGYLHQPYIWFLNQHSADLGKNILSQVGVVVGNALLPMINLIVQSTLALSLLMVLLFVDAVLAITVGFVLGVSYIVVLFLTKGLIDRLGKLSFNSNHDRFMVVNEAFSAAKEVKLSGLEKVYIERFSFPAKVYAKTQAAASIIGQLPRFFFEAIAFGGMLVVTLILMYRGDDGLNAALPIIVLYAFAGYRLMPALQQIYGAFTQIRFASHAVNLLHSEVRELNAVSAKNSNTKKISVNSSIKLRNVVFRYPNASNDALKGLNIDIPANQIIGFVGSSGSGKSTTIDLILGLLNPTEGELRVDGECINSNNLRGCFFGPMMTGTLFFGISQADSNYLGYTLSALALGLAPMSINLIALRGLNAFENVKLQVLSNSIMNVIAVVVSIGVALALPPQWVTVGLAGAWALSYFFGAWNTIYLLRRFEIKVSISEVAGFYLKLGALALVVAVPVWFLRDLIPGGNIVRLTIVLVVCGIGYLALCKITRVSEVTSAIQLLARRRKIG